MHPKVKLALLLVLLLLVVGMILLFGYSQAKNRSQPKFRIATENRTKFSDVFVLIDTTESMNESDVENAKKIVNERILSSLGVNDKASGFMLDGAFQDSKSIVFGVADQQPPKLDGGDPEKILELVKGKGDLREPQICNEDAFNLLQNVKAKQPGANAQQQQWQSKITTLSRPAVEGSNYVKALEGIVKLMDHKKSDPDRDVRLFVVGDLKNQPKPVHLIPADPAAFNHVNVWLIYPYNSNDQSWPTTEEFWNNYFAQIKHVEKRTFANALNQEFLIKPNPTSGVETIPGEDSWHVFRPYLIAAGIVYVMGMVGIYLLIRRRRRPTLASLSLKKGSVVPPTRRPIA
jgi:hypothetical protein